MTSASPTHRSRGLTLTTGAAVTAALGWSLGSAPGAAAEQGASGAELVFEQTAEPIEGVEPGDAAEVSFAVKNTGDAPATRVVLYLSGSQGLAYADRYSNCVYEDAPAQDEGRPR